MESQSGAANSTTAETPAQSTVIFRLKRKKEQEPIENLVLEDDGLGSVKKAIKQQETNSSQWSLEDHLRNMSIKQENPFATAFGSGAHATLVLRRVTGGKENDTRAELRAQREKIVQDDKTQRRKSLLQSLRDKSAHQDAKEPQEGTHPEAARVVTVNLSLDRARQQLRMIDEGDEAKHVKGQADDEDVEEDLYQLEIVKKRKQRVTRGAKRKNRVDDPNNIPDSDDDNRNDYDYYDDDDDDDQYEQEGEQGAKNYFYIVHHDIDQKYLRQDVYGQEIGVTDGEKSDSHDSEDSNRESNSNNTYPSSEDDDDDDDYDGGDYDSNDDYDSDGCRRKKRGGTRRKRRNSDDDDDDHNDDGDYDDDDGMNKSSDSERRRVQSEDLEEVRSGLAFLRSQIQYKNSLRPENQEFDFDRDF